MTGRNNPLVTFGLVAYNQQRFIAEAVQGALAQTYRPLEVILSDDASEDKTFSIMEQLVSKYRGPNAVRLRVNERNLGIARHVDRVLSAAQGEIFVLAAGDDISTPNRVERTVDAFVSNPSAFCVESDFMLWADGEFCQDLPKPDRPRRLSLKRASRLASGCVMGAAAAYRREIRDLFGPIRQAGAPEDAVLSFRALLLGGIQRIDDVLVLKRIVRGSAGLAGIQPGPGSRLDLLQTARAARFRLAARRVVLRDLTLGKSLGLIGRAEAARLILNVLLGGARDVPRTLLDSECGLLRACAGAGYDWGRSMRCLLARSRGAHQS